MRGAQSGSRWIGGAFIGALIFFYDAPYTLAVYALHVGVAGLTLVGLAIVGRLLESNPKER